LTVSALLEALELELELELALALALALAELELELELEVELEHPVVAARPAATTVTPSRAAARRLDIFTRRLVSDPSDARYSRVKRPGEWTMARRRPILRTCGLMPVRGVLVASVAVFPELLTIPFGICPGPQPEGRWPRPHSAI
jgi:hypothetical protein